MKTIEVPREGGVLDEGRAASVVAVAGGSAASTPAPMPKGKTLDEKAYSNGWNARLRESPTWACPHRNQSGLAFMWEMGWRDCDDSIRARRRLARQQNDQAHTRAGAQTVAETTDSLPKNEL